MYITPFSPRAADSCIILLVLPSLGGREDLVWLPTVYRWEREDGRRKGEREGGKREGPAQGHTLSYRG